MKILFLLLFSIGAFAAFTEPDRALMTIRNLLKNPGWEQSTSNWVVTGGTYTTTSTAANLGSGNAAGSWDSNGAAQTLISTAVTTPAGLYAQNGVASCNFKCASGTCTHTITAWDGTNDLSTVTIVSSSTYARTSTNFIFPSSGTIAIKVASVASNEPTLYVDDCYVGSSSGFNIFQSSTAEFIGNAYIATTGSCTWSRTNTALGAFSTTSACPGPTVDSNPGTGTIQTTDADLPRFTVNNLPPGNYRILMTGNVKIATSAQAVTFGINDGTNTKGVRTFDANTSTYVPFMVEANFQYTTSGNKTFELYGASAANAITIDNSLGATGGGGVQFYIYKFPSSTETILRPESQAFAWSGYHDQDCNFVRTTTGSFGAFPADSTCTFTERTNLNAGTVTSELSGSDKLPGIVITLPSAGMYEVCASPNFEQGQNAGDTGIRMVKGATVISRVFKKLDGNDQDDTHMMCGFYNASTSGSATFSLEGYTSAVNVEILSSTSVNTSIEWSIKKVSQNLPAPNIVNTVSNSSSGVSRMEAAKLNCDSSSAITSQHGSWVSSIGNISAGACTVTLSAGTFSATPYCIASDTSTNPFIVSANATSSTSVAIDCDQNDGTDCTAFDAVLMCFGAK